MEKSSRLEYERLEKLAKDQPGKVIGTADTEDPEVIFWLNADGGCLWFCATCQDYAWPNRPCPC